MESWRRFSLGLMIKVLKILTTNPATWLKQNICFFFFFTKNCPQDQCQPYAVHKYPILLSDKSLLRPILHEILFLTLNFFSNHIQLKLRFNIKAFFVELALISNLNSKKPFDSRPTKRESLVLLILLFCTS